MHQFIFSPVALIEYKDAVVWYKERSSKAAENFVQQIHNKIDKIATRLSDTRRPINISEKHL